MKFILSFLFAFVFISPVMAAYNPGTSYEVCTDISESNQCKQQQGCGDWVELFGCSQCQSGTYNDGNFSACQPCSGDPDYTVIDNDQTKRHPDGAASCSDWECASGTPIDTDNDNIVDSCADCDPNSLPSNAVFVDASCNWICNAGWYRYNNGCASCPTGYVNPVAGATSISQCNCPTGQNIIANPNDATGYFCEACDAYTTYDPDTFSCVCNVTYSHQATLLSCACPTHSTPNGGTCVCDGGWYMPVPSNEQNPRPTTCLSCPDNAECSNNEVTCGQNTIKTVNTDGTVTCATCGANAGVYDGVCKCDVNAYGNGTNCTRCPAGTFLTTQGTSGENNATAITDCQMNHNTQFCDANDQNCMQLIPES